MGSYRFQNREISWLAFNHRVLQEATDPRVPVAERLRYLAIFSSNLDEFYRTRVAAIRVLRHLGRKTREQLSLDPDDLLNRIRSTVHEQQEKFGTVFRTGVMKEFNARGVFLVNETDLTENQALFVRNYFHDSVEPHCAPIFLNENREAPFLDNRALYLAVRLLPMHQTPRVTEEENDFLTALVEIPSQLLPRFLQLPLHNGQRCVIMLDDVIRLCLPELFGHHQIHGVYAVKLTRDAGLGIDDEFSGDLLEKIREGLKRRKTGVASRFLYDSEMPNRVLKQLRKVFSLRDDDLVPGARYHNFNDFMRFPDGEIPNAHFPSLTPLRHPMDKGSLFEAMGKEDFAVHYPYQDFGTVVRYLREASHDPAVTSIRITLYRLAAESQIVQALVEAARNGKSVTGFVEVKARFDEESNLHWAEEMQKAGVRILYSIPGLKVHCKMCLITRMESGSLREYLYLSSGNFNEKTARIYSDLGLFTADRRLAKDARRVFAFLEGKNPNPRFKHLLVAPFTLRKGLLRLIDREIRMARKGRTARIFLKMNSLEDPTVIERLYEASCAGVSIHLVVRGICCLIPGVKGMSENITVTSIVDRFLEHMRLYIFHNDGDELYYASSADLMTRNLSRRVEVMFPIYNDGIKSELRAIAQTQREDSAKSRIIDKAFENRYRENPATSTSKSPQEETYRYLERQASGMHSEVPAHHHRMIRERIARLLSPVRLQRSLHPVGAANTSPPAVEC